MIGPKHSFRRAAAHTAELFRALRLEESGVAAVEFALILPLMLLIYLGSDDLTLGLMAARKATLVSRTLSDLISQQQNQLPVTDADLTSTFAAANAIMAPFPASTMKMTITSVEFVADAGAATGYDAMPRWSATLNGGISRTQSCGALNPVANSAAPVYNNLPVGVYAQGGLVIADVSYTYAPTFGASFFTAFNWTQPLVNFSHTTYMRPRQWSGNPGYITYTPGNMAQTCP